MTYYRSSTHNPAPAPRLIDLADVDITYLPTSGSPLSLVYDPVRRKWILSTTGGGGGSTTLAALTDVALQLPLTYGSFLGVGPPPNLKWTNFPSELFAFLFDPTRTIYEIFNFQGAGWVTPARLKLYCEPDLFPDPQYRPIVLTPTGIASPGTMGEQVIMIGTQRVASSDVGEATIHIGLDQGAHYTGEKNVLIGQATIRNDNGVTDPMSNCILIGHGIDTVVGLTRVQKMLTIGSDIDLQSASLLPASTHLGHDISDSRGLETFPAVAGWGGPVVIGSIDNDTLTPTGIAGLTLAQPNAGVYTEGSDEFGASMRVQINAAHYDIALRPVPSTATLHPPSRYPIFSGFYKQFGNGAPATISIPNNTWTTLELDSGGVQSNAGYWNFASPTEFTPLIDGMYRIEVRIIWATRVNGTRRLGINVVELAPPTPFLVAQETFPLSTIPSVTMGSMTSYMGGGVHFQVQVFQDSGSPLNILNGVGESSIGFQFIGSV